MRKAPMFFAAVIGVALSGQGALAESAASTARNLLPMGGDTGHSAVDVRQGLVGGPIALPRSRRPVVDPGFDPEFTGSIRRPAYGPRGGYR